MLKKLATADIPEFPDQANAGTTAEIYSSMVMDDQNRSQPVYAIKNDAGEMVPVDYDMMSNNYIELPADALNSLPDLPSWPSTNSVKLYQTFLTQVTDADGNSSWEFTAEDHYR